MGKKSTLSGRLGDALFNHDLAEVKRLLAQGAQFAPPYWTFHDACGSDSSSEELCLALLDLGVDGRQADRTGRTPLHKAVDSKKTRLVEALLDRGADLEARHDGGRTPLMVAAASGRATMVRLLLARGARVDGVDNDGRTAIELATTPAIRALLEKASASPRTAAPKARPAPTRQTRALPAEYQKFIDDELHTRYEGKRSSLLDDGFERLPVRFAHDDDVRAEMNAQLLADLGDVLVGDEREAIILVGALAYPRRRNSYAAPLVLDLWKARKGTCPVFLYVEGSFQKIAPSLTAFLESLA